MVLSSKRGRRRNGSRDLTLEGSPTVEVFKILTSLSLLPKPAWGLSKELQREVKVAVKIIVRKQMPAAMFRALLTTRTVKHLVVHGTMSRLHVMPDTMGALELHGVGGRLKDMPQHLHSLTLVLPRVMGSAYAAAYLTMLPETVRSLALHAMHCQANLTDLALPARLRTLQLTHMRELPALPVSLSSITLQSCSLEALVQLPPSVTDVSLNETSARTSDHTTTSIAVVGPALRRLHLLGLVPSWAVQPLPQDLIDLHLHYKPHSWRQRTAVALTVLPESLETLTLSCDAELLDLTISALPHGLKTLDATRFATYNSTVTLGPLPESLTRLSLGKSFEHALGALPAGLMELRIRSVSGLGGGCFFNQPLGALPPLLRVLDLRACNQFNHPLGHLPCALRELRLGVTFNCPLLPQHVSLPAVQGQQAVLPALDAELAAEPVQPPPDALVRLPETLTVLHIDEFFDRPLGPLPEGLTELRTHRFTGICRFNRALGTLPAALRVLDLAACGPFSHALGRLPDALRELRLSRVFNHPLPQLPARLEVLALGFAFDAALPAALPRTLRELHMGRGFNAPLALPPGLEVLIIGDSYTHRLDLAALPLKKLDVGRRYAHTLPPLPIRLSLGRPRGCRHSTPHPPLTACCRTAQRSVK
eukprot:TRINITY_DN5537_c0_g1_i5.p1 TRINITY_DN5537_c0_g1~~TRINITY_DN5537_c0_g1_i5.p1  ORF type:complete len:649 (+),score=128.92 TRINITY_DN5537_c0_g1_i5:130-2076(+)